MWFDFISMQKKILALLILFVLVIPVILPLLQPGFFVTDDGNWMIIRLSAFHQTLRLGQFPVRFLERLNHGLGYPVLDFLYPLPFYLGEVIHIFGFGFIDSVKILFILSSLLGAFFMYQYAGLAAAVIYTYLPYRFFDVYTRGSLGESVAFIFLPLIFYTLDKKKILLASIATAALITSHNVIAFLFLPVIAFYAVFKTKSWKFVSCFLFLGFLLSAWFWLPALYDLRFTRAASIAVSDFSQYFVTWGNFLPIVGIVIPIILLLSLKTKTRLFLVVALVSLVFTLPISAPLWRLLPLPKLVQFPWRFLSLTVFAAAVLVGRLPKKVGIFLVVLTVIFSLPFLQVNRTFHPESYYTTNDDSTTVKNEYNSKWLTVNVANKPPQEVVQLSPTRLRVYKMYFPGLEAYVDGVKTLIDYQTSGFVELNVSPGSHIVTTHFTETPVRLFADLLTVLGIIFIIISWFSKTVFPKGIRGYFFGKYK